MIALCGFGVSNYYNKLKLILLEKGIPFRERVVYPWERETFRHCSPLGKIPFIETEEGGLSEPRPSSNTWRSAIRPARCTPRTCSSAPSAAS